MLKAALGTLCRTFSAAKAAKPKAKPGKNTKLAVEQKKRVALRFSIAKKAVKKQSKEESSKQFEDALFTVSNEYSPSPQMLQERNAIERTWSSFNAGRLHQRTLKESLILKHKADALERVRNMSAFWYEEAAKIDYSLPADRRIPALGKLPSDGA